MATKMFGGKGKPFGKPKETKADMAEDKKKGIKQGSARDTRMDRRGK